MTGSILGAYVDPTLAEDEYHARPELSCSGAKLLLPPSCPAIFRHRQDNPPGPKDAFDFGTAAHTEALGTGQGFDRLDFPDRRTNAYKAAAAESRAEGRIPLLAPAYDAVIGMADALRLDPIAGPFFRRGGIAEASFFWTDPETEVNRRARFDWVGDDADDSPIADYKTAASAEPTKWAKAAADFGYHQQHPWYQDAHEAVAGVRRPFVFIVQEKEPPYLVSVVQLDEEWVAVGRRKNRAAIEVFRDCLDEGEWPAYTSGEVALVSRPAYSDREWTA